MIEVEAKQALDHSSSRSRTAMTVVSKVTVQPSLSLLVFYRLVAVAVGSIFLIIGAGYALGGTHALTSNGLVEIEVLERSLRVHGWLLMVLGLALVASLNGPRPVTRGALCGVFAYSLFTSLEIFAGWHTAGVNWGWPFWYLFVAFLTLLLIIFCPHTKR